MWINPWIQSSTPLPIFMQISQCRVPRILIKVNQLPTLLTAAYRPTAKLANLSSKI